MFLIIFLVLFAADRFCPDEAS